MLIHWSRYQHWARLHLSWPIPTDQFSQKAPNAATIKKKKKSTNRPMQMPWFTIKMCVQCLFLKRDWKLSGKTFFSDHFSIDFRDLNKDRKQTTDFQELKKSFRLIIKLPKSGFRKWTLLAKLDPLLPGQLILTAPHPSQEVLLHLILS